MCENDGGGANRQAVSPSNSFCRFNLKKDTGEALSQRVIPLAKLPPEQLDWINTLVGATLNKKEVIEQVEEYFGRRTERESPCWVTSEITTALLGTSGTRHSKTLIGLKRPIEVVRNSGGTRSVVLAGHPKLKNDLRRPSMEEIGSRATIFELESLGSEKRKYLKWLSMRSVAPKTKIESVITEDENGDMEDGNSFSTTESHHETNPPRTGACPDSHHHGHRAPRTGAATPQLSAPRRRGK
jgi:hypothetical protein